MTPEDIKRAEQAVMSAVKSRNADKFFILTDSTVNALTYGLFPGVSRLVVEPGESSKSLEGATKVWNFLEDSGALRRSVLVNIGGGMISDLGGFAASTFKRGIGCINLPTTLLAAVDAAIGGKTGINFNGLKNEIGTFSLPLAVMPLTSLFGNLPEEEWLSGVGEVIKTALLESQELYEMATSEAFIIERKPELVEEVVNRCAAFKQSVVERDFREGGLRRILNLGHTAGHAFESLAMARGYHLPHGIAVAHGLKITLEKSVMEAGLNPGVLNNYLDVLSKFFPPLSLSRDDFNELENFMAHDKKNSVIGKPEWVLLHAIGEPILG